jgi:hypothetical protein
MLPAAYYLTYLREAVDSLDEYLLSKELFWNMAVNPPSGNPPYPALTLGGILFFLSQLNAMDLAFILNPAEAAEFKNLSQAIHAKRTKWRTAWEQKAAHSFRARLTQWANFIEEYRQKPEAHADRYGYEVRVRFMLTVLGEESPGISSEQSQFLDSLDVILQYHLQAGQFIWDETLAQGYHREKFWYLYGFLPAKDFSGQDS